MEIKKASKSQVKSDINTAGLSQAISASGSIENSIRKEQAVANQIAGVTTDLFVGELKRTAEENALLDAASNQKSKDSFSLAEEEFNKAEEDIALLGFEAEEDLTEDQLKLYKKYDAADTKRKEAKLELKKNPLELESKKFGVYGRAYNAKAQAIGLQRVVIDLSQTATEVAIKHKEDPTAYAAEMQIYRDTVKKSLPENMHEAYDQKVAVANNTALNAINKNVTDIQDQELAAATIENLDITQTNLYDAADNQDAPAYVAAKKEYRTQLDTLVRKRLITPTKADALYRTADIQATQQLVMSNFKEKLETDPLEAIKYAGTFAKNTSEQQYGLSTRQEESQGKKNKAGVSNTLNIEYDTEERDKIANLMFAAIKKYKTALKAGNKSNKSTNNAYVDQAISVLKSGHNFKDTNGTLTGLNSSNTNGEKLQELNFYQKNWANIANFTSQDVVAMEDQLTELKKNKDSEAYDQDLIKVYDDVLNQRKADLKTDPANVLSTSFDMKDVPAFDPRKPAEYIKSIMKYSKYQNLENGSAVNLLTVAQMDQVKANWDQLGSMDKIQYINSIGGGEEAELFFKQMGTEALTLYKISQSKAPTSNSVAQAIVLGQDKIANGLKPYKENDVEAYITANTNGRETYRSGKEIKGARKAIIALAVQMNPNVTELTEEHIKKAMDMVYGATGDLGGADIEGSGGWTSFDTELNENMVIYEKDVDFVETKIEGITLDQVALTIPTDSKFYAKDELKHDVLIQDMKLGKVQFVGTGISGEYTLIRGGVPIVLSTPGPTQKDGKTYNVLSEYKFKLWDNTPKPKAK